MWPESQRKAQTGHDLFFAVANAMVENAVDKHRNLVELFFVDMCRRADICVRPKERHVTCMLMLYTVIGRGIIHWPPFRAFSWALASRAARTSGES